MLAVFALSPWSNGSDARTLVHGDATCDGTVGPLDALADLEATAGIEPPAPCVSSAGDADCDDEIDVADVAAILRYSALGVQPAGAPPGCPPLGEQVPTGTPTATASATATVTSSATPTVTPTATATASATPSATPTRTASGTPTRTATATPTGAVTCTGPGGGPTLPPAPGSAGTPAAESYDVTQVLSANDLGAAADSMIEFALIPGRPNEAIVADQSGYIYRVALNQSFPPQLWGDLHSEVNFDGEEGLLSLAFSPNYQNDCRVYLYYTPGSPDASVLSRFLGTPTGGLNEGSEEKLLTVEQPYDNHNGGHIVFGNDGYLHIAFGDGGNGGDPGDRAQKMSTLLGKMIRIDVSAAPGYTIPSGNMGGSTCKSPRPQGNTTPCSEIYAVGFRNPFRFTSDPVSGQIWIGDVGQEDWEEVDRLVQGGNFGWDCYEGSDEYDPLPPEKCDKTFTWPRAVYSHHDGDGNQAVTGGVIYRGNALPELYGWYLYADFYSGNIWALNPNDSSDPVMLIHHSALSYGISAFTLAANGDAYLVSYNDGVYRLTR